MKLTHLTDKFLLSETKLLVGKERSATTEVLHHLKEIDRRRLYSEVKCSSLFQYCTRELGYSEASAQRRIVAARMIEEMPEIEQKIEDGTLSLTNLSLMNQFFKDSEIEEKKVVLKEIENLTKNECEKKLFELSGKEVKPPKDSKKRISKDKTQVSIVLSDETLEAIEEVKNLIGSDLDMNRLILFMAKKSKACH